MLRIQALNFGKHSTMWIWNLNKKPGMSYHQLLGISNSNVIQWKAIALIPLVKKLNVQKHDWKVKIFAVYKLYIIIMKRKLFRLRLKFNAETIFCHFCQYLHEIQRFTFFIQTILLRQAFQFAYILTFAWFIFFFQAGEFQGIQNKQPLIYFSY